jgi:hypothetical protein
MRFLDRLGANRGAREREMRADHVHRVFRPEALDRFEVFLEAPHAVLLRGAEREVLDVAVAERGAEDHPPAAHDVDSRDLLGDVERLVERQEHQPEVEPHARRLGHDPGQERELLQVPPRRGAVVHALGDGGVPAWQSPSAAAWLRA